MARIAESELQHLKTAVSLVAVAQQQGRQLYKRGQDRVTLCPFHDEKTPPCVISPVKNLYHCFGCNAGGSVLDWLMHTEKLSLRKAVERLRAELGENPAVVPLMQPGDPVHSVEDEAGRQALLERVTAFYHQTLLNAPEAIAYLDKRHLHHPELVAQFRLGFANRTLAYRLPPKARKEGAEIRARLQALGLMRESGHEHFTGSLVVPVADLHGQIREIYGRKIDRPQRGMPAHLYLAGPHHGVWNEQALIGSKAVILCESLIDAMSFWVSGHRNVTAAYGVNGFTDDHRKAFADHGVKQVIIAFDNDAAGNEAAVTLAAELAGMQIDAFRIGFPAGMDANGYLCQVAEPALAFRLLIESAQPMRDAVAVEPVNEPAMPLVQAGDGAGTGSSLAAAATAEPGVVVERGDAGEVTISLGPQRWRVRGLAQVKPGAAVMKLNVQLLDTESGAAFADGVEMMSARSRAGYARQAAVELGLAEGDVKRSLGRVLLALENHLAQPEPEESGPAMTAAERAEALELLRDPQLAERVTADLASCGVVGESTNLLTAYLAATSRRLERPLAVLIQSSSAAGKSSLMDAVLGLMPEEERVQYSAMTGQSLFYLGETSMQHKILAIAEEEGVRQAAYALKLLQSDGELTIASTGKDEATGNLVTKQYTVKGPVMLMLTTTAIDVDEELLNRCLVLTVNESREQTEAIHAMQRHAQTLDGLLAGNEKAHVTRLHRNAQRLLKPLNVVNPFASQLTFMSDKTRTRRDHMKYLTLIQSVEHRGQALEYIEVARSDIALANRLAHEILGRTLDEMPPQTRRLLMLVQGWVKDSGQPRSEWLFTRKMLRDAVQWGDTQLKVHLARLVEMEYLLLHRRGLTFLYELLFDGEDGDGAHLCGLIEPQYDNARSGLEVSQPASGRQPVVVRSGGKKAPHHTPEKA